MPSPTEPLFRISAPGVATPRGQLEDVPTTDLQAQGEGWRSKDERTPFRGWTGPTAGTTETSAWSAQTCQPRTATK